jgi:hypothetical protein
LYHEDIIVNAAEDLSKFAKYPEGQYIELVHNSGKNAILTKGLPIPVEWYDENERRLTGNGYPDTLTAGLWTSSSLSAARAQSPSPQMLLPTGG